MEASARILPCLKAADAARADRFRHMAGVLDPGAEQQPRAAVLAVGHHLVDRSARDRIAIDRGLQLTGDELAASRSDAAHVEGQLRRLADKRA
jgi:hypothetical protein